MEDAVTEDAKTPGTDAETEEEAPDAEVADAAASEALEGATTDTEEVAKG